MATLTPEAKQLLSATIRSLRDLLLKDLQAEAEGRYQLAVPLAKAGLDEAHRVRRERLEHHIDEQLRASGASKKEEKATRERLFKTAVKQASATFLNRVVALRHLEALGLSKPAVLIGGWNSKGYREFREFAPGLTSDETQGYATLLGYVFDELAVDLPGLFGDVGISSLFPIRAATLREVVERLDAPELASAWTDDTTLGWVYQYWNDPEREALDAKINARGKIEPHEIAPKTQMFTERYMVEWLLHNSLGLTWLCICKKRGWTADAERVLPLLDDRRAEWRKKRDAGEVALDALMPIHDELEEHWKYYVPQPIPDDAVEKAPNSIRDLKLLDPACGSGHFLVIAFDLLAALYREEARHERRDVSDKEIAESILENNLFGIDIDPRATQIAAAGLLIKAKLLSSEVHPKRLNLVAPALQLGSLPDDDPSLVQLREELRAEVGVPEELTRKIVKTLEGVDHLGSLLKVDRAVESAIREHEEFLADSVRVTMWLFEDDRPPQREFHFNEARRTILDKVEQFLAKHSRSEDLGLRLGGEQLAAGVRFVRMVKEGTYDIVVGNPPYQGTSKMADAGYVARHYPKGKADLYAAFLERGLQLVREGGISALLTMRGWMFLAQFRELRENILRQHDLRSLGDFDRGAFDAVPNEVLAVAAPVLRRAAHPALESVAVQPTPLDDKSYDRQRTSRKRAAVLAQVGRYDFDPRGFKVIEGEPIVYWWSKGFLVTYAAAPKLGRSLRAFNGLSTQNNVRFLRVPWEVQAKSVWCSRDETDDRPTSRLWFPYIKGGAGDEWFESLSWVVPWEDASIALRVFLNEYQMLRPGGFIKHEDKYFRLGVAFSVVGAAFSGRAHRYRSIFGHMGSSVFPADPAATTCLFNSSASRSVLQSLNPSVHFLAGDVDRLPVLKIDGAEEIFDRVEEAFSVHEESREASVEFRRPGSSPWRSTQLWAQQAVDRLDGEPLPPYAPQYESPKPTDFISFALGVALGRFAANGDGVLDAAPDSAVTQGVLYISATPHPDSLAHLACRPLVTAWNEHGQAVDTKFEGLGDYLRRGFFNDVHRPMYENRPIYFPLSSSRRNFVAYASIHRFMPTWNDVDRTGATWEEAEKRGFTWDSFGDTALHVLLAEHLLPEQRHLEGELEDLRKARTEAGKKGAAEKRFAEVQKLLEELNDFIEKVTQVAEKGPPPPDDKTPPREVDARFAMDLDDGVMVNSAALWPLLEAQWKDPKKWWKELATAKGRKDYDWSHLAERYFPTRVAEKCLQDPSLAVAHRRFWKLWPEKAYAWELRLQDEIRPDFTIDEPESNEARATFLAEHPARAAELRAAEDKRRERKAAKAEGDSEGPLFEGATEEETGGDEDQEDDDG